MISGPYRWLLRLGKVTGAVSFLLAAPYAFGQYVQSKDAGRVEQTLTLFKMYNAAPFTGYREKLTKALVKNKDKIDKASQNVAAFEALQFRIVRQENMEAELLLLFDFFDGVTFCVTANLCDNDTAIRLFKPRAADIYVNFFQYMMKQRGKSTTRGFGIGVEAIAKSSLEPPSWLEFWKRI